MVHDPTPISPGSVVLHYRLNEKLGEGGMGVVWSATDTSLDRRVAVKILPPAFAADPERLLRFEREAKLLASLNHPNIATVFSVHQVEEDRYLVMEIVPGEDLAQRISRGPVPVAECLDIARQIALALEAAHEAGVVHRDLKPANIRITPDDRVKVLDFGLAKAMEPAAASGPALSQSPTMVSAMTSGMILGTAAYMSPEQARGQAVDRRADIWAFGVVLYEMLTGRRGFEGETVSDTLAAVLRAEPDRGALPGDLPPALRRLLDRCLDKNPRRRLRDMGEAVVLLEDLQAGTAHGAPEAAAPAAPRAPGRERLAWGLGLAAALAAGAAGAWMLRPAAPEPPLRKVTVKVGLEDLEAPVISPDGRRIAFQQDEGLWVLDLDQLAPRRLAGPSVTNFRPVWSPDGAHIAFLGGSNLMRVAVAGGPATPVCRVDPVQGGGGGTWTADGRIVFALGRDHLYVVPAGGGVAAVHTAVRDSIDLDVHHPHALPGDRGFLCVRHLQTTGPNVLAHLEDGVFTDLVTIPSGVIWEPVYDPRGYIVFARIGEGAGVWAAPFTLDPPAVTGEAFLIAANATSASVGNDGTFVYQLGARSLESQVVAVDRAGTVLEEWTDIRTGNFTMALSPDGNRVAIDRREGGDPDVWIHDRTRRSATRFAFGAGRQGGPAWSPDGRWLVYSDNAQVTLKPADGSREGRHLGQGIAASFTPDGARVVYQAGSPADLWSRSVDDPADSAVIVATPAAETQARVGPGGDYLIYVSDESGRDEVYLRQFPSGGGRWQVSTNGGGKPVWSAAGDRVFYHHEGVVYEVDAELHPEVALGTPRELFRLSRLGFQSWGGITFLPTADPDRFLVFKLGNSDAAADIVVVDSWPREFRESP